MKKSIAPVALIASVLARCPQSWCRRYFADESLSASRS
jgi:hypothetical protein